MVRRVVYSIASVIILGSQPVMAHTEFQSQDPTIRYSLTARDPGTPGPDPSKQKVSDRRLLQNPGIFRQSSIRFVAPKFRYELDRGHRLWMIIEGRRIDSDLIINNHGLHRFNVRLKSEFMGVKVDPGFGLNFSEYRDDPASTVLQARTRITLSEFDRTIHFEAWREVGLNTGSYPTYRYAVFEYVGKSGVRFGGAVEQVLLEEVLVDPLLGALTERPINPTIRKTIRKQLKGTEYGGSFIDYPLGQGYINLWFSARNGYNDWYFRVSYQNFK